MEKICPKCGVSTNTLNTHINYMHKGSMQGKTKWFNDGKGYGFITSDSKDYFVHYADIQGDGFKTLTEGQEVSFDAYDSGKGLQAKNVTKL